MRGKWLSQRLFCKRKGEAVRGRRACHVACSMRRRSRYSHIRGGGRNSADLAVRLRNADAKSKYQYELVVLDDECKPDAGVQVTGTEPSKVSTALAR